MKTIHQLLAYFLITIVLFGCSTENSVNMEDAVTIKDPLVNQLVDMINENFDHITQTLSSQKLPVSVHTLFTPSTISKTSNTFLKTAKNQENEALLESYELWMHQSISGDFTDMLIAIAPEDENIDQITAYDLQGNPVILDGNIKPNIPVIVLEKNGFHSLQLKANAINDALIKAGLKSTNSLSNNKFLSKAAIATTKLEKIELDNDQEPWIKGGAEIYAITSGIKNTSNSPEMNVIPMYYLDYEDEAYYPNQLLLFWDDYKYQAANIQLFEDDSDYNYQELISILVTEISGIAGDLSGLPWLGALGRIASVIIDAIPSGTFTDDDDYVDSFYTIEKNKSYVNYKGAARNATVTLKPFTLLEN